MHRTVANNLGINPGGRPLLFVIKKNVSVLRNLQSWLMVAEKRFRRLNDLGQRTQLEPVVFGRQFKLQVFGSFGGIPQPET